MCGKAHNRAFGPIPRSIRVVALVERNRRIRSFHVPNVTANNLAPLVARHAHRNSRLMTDESNVHSHAGTWFKSHHTVNPSVKEYVRDQQGYRIWPSTDRANSSDQPERLRFLRIEMSGRAVLRTLSASFRNVVMFSGP